MNYTSIFSISSKSLAKYVRSFLATEVAFSILGVSLEKKIVFLLEVSIVNNCLRIEFQKNWKSMRYIKLIKSVTNKTIKSATLIYFQTYRLAFCQSTP